MRVEIKLTGKSNDTLNLLKHLKGNQAINTAFNKSGAIIRKTARNLMLNTPKTGRAYKINGKIHITSSAGNAPAVLNGKLLKSTEFVATGNNLEIGYTAKYGKYLELGTKKMAKRPALIPAITTHIKTIERHLVREYNNELKKCKK